MAPIANLVWNRILEATDANGFASLALVNSKWRSVAQQAHLYAHHLATCPSYAMSHNGKVPAATEENLPTLRSLFAKEVKRNLFEAYLRPSQTIIKLISNSFSSSSSPGGEGIQFSPSPLGHHILACNSSRIYVIDVRGPEIDVKRELKILRRPAATCITDNGSLLAVLLTEMQVDLYDLTEVPPKRTQSLILDHSPRAIALSPCGSVLTAAYEGGIEVSSINPGALATQRRAVKCDAVDSLSFSFDGRQILGTTVQSSPPSTVILTAPYYDPGSHMADDDISALWTTSILFPNSSRDCSHAVLIQDGRHEEAFWSFTYDRSFETFRAVRIDDLRNGTTYFTGPIPSTGSQAKLLPCTLPSASYHGDLVSAGFQGKEVWLYGVPEDLDAVPDSGNGETGPSPGAGGLNRRNSGPSNRAASKSQETDDLPRVPQWQVLCDKQRNTFVSGVKIGELDGVNLVKWIGDFGNSVLRERLVVAARGITPGRLITEEEGIDFIDGGRITLLDFDYGLEDGQVTEITIEVGTKEPEILEEESRDMETEVAIVRRRTVAQKRGHRSVIMRSATTAAAAAVPPIPAPSLSAVMADDRDADPLVPRRMGAPPATDEPSARGGSEETEGEAFMEELEALDDPYSHTGPRSGTTLRRAATAAAVHRRLHPQAAAAGRVEYRRADGRAEHPHESDADNWKPPPPPYQKEDPGDTPAFLRHAIPSAPSGENTAGDEQPETDPLQRSMTRPPQPVVSAQQPLLARSHTTGPAPRAGFLPPDRAPPVPPVPQLPRVTEDNQVRGGAMLVPQPGELSRPTTMESRFLDGDNIYDVSPPRSPLGAGSFDSGSSPGRQRTVSIVSTGGFEASAVLSTMPATATSSFQQAVPPSQPGSLAPVLNLHIPSPVVDNMPQWNATNSVATPHVRRLSSNNTWPLAPAAHTIPTVLSAGYPYSAPPTNSDANQAIGQAYPPAPHPAQLASLHNRHPDQVPRRLSGGFQVPRWAGEDFSSRNPQQPRPVSQLYSPPQPGYSLGPLQAPLPAPELSHQARMSWHQPRYSNEVMQPMPQRLQSIPAAVEDMPLIISTPKGVSGAFDAPAHYTTTQHPEPEIIAPVPRHPRPSTQPAVLRPVADRLDTLYSISISADNEASRGAHGGPDQANPAAGPSGPSVTSSQRLPVLLRKPSRAERSAAKNIADAKRRGWTGRHKSMRRGKKNKEREFDVASSAAWTDVTTFSGDETVPPLPGFEQRDQEQRKRQRSKLSNKCVVM